jgi:hypothetical protein
VALLHEGRVEELAAPQDFLKASGAEARTFLACLDWKLSA